MYIFIYNIIKSNIIRCEPERFGTKMAGAQLRISSSVPKCSPVSPSQKSGFAAKISATEFSFTGEVNFGKRGGITNDETGAAEMMIELGRR